MGCQKVIINKIRKKKGDYVVALKLNQHSLYKNLSSHIKSYESKEFAKLYDEIDDYHGRETRRRYFGR